MMLYLLIGAALAVFHTGRAFERQGRLDWMDVLVVMTISVLWPIWLACLGLVSWVMADVTKSNSDAEKRLRSTVAAYKNGGIRKATGEQPPAP
jgi:type VI protein secretion system component VasK